MEVLINAGGKGSRMGQCGIEKPMHIIGGVPVVRRVVDAMRGASGIDRVIVSVSPNTVETGRYLEDNGIEVIRTTGDDFMMDMRDSFSVLEGDYVMVCPSDMPMLSSPVVEDCLLRFRPEMQSMVVMVRASIVREMGVIPSYSCNVFGTEYVLSGLSIMDRRATLAGEYLKEDRYLTDYCELAVNVNTPGELELARKMCSQ